MTTDPHDWNWSRRMGKPHNPNDWAYCPRNGPPRLIRFVEKIKFPPDALAVYDETKNLVWINKKRYDKLSYVDKALTLKTKQSLY